jgi:hypothetical protein
MRFTPPDMLPSTVTVHQEHPLDVVLDENALCDRYADASPGDAIVYHLGLLARDRDKQTSTLPPQRRQDLEAVARRAWRMAEAGQVHLLQRRVGPETFAHLLVVRPRMATSAAVTAARAA